MKSRDKIFDTKYDAYVDHPRYGKRPRFTALNPNPYDPDVLLHPNATNLQEINKRYRRIMGEDDPLLRELGKSIGSRKLDRIAGTAVKADPSKQHRSTVPVTHYYDVERVCRSCKRPFIFFAEEQRYWYESLRFPLDADCIRCPECRKTERFLARNRATYERLMAEPKRSWEDNLTMAECALLLVEHGVFQNRVLERIRALLKTVPEMEREKVAYQGLVNRLKLVKRDVTRT